MNVLAPNGRVIVLVDTREDEGGIVLTDGAKWRAALGGCSEVFPGVVRSSGIDGFPTGSAVFVRTEAAHCLTVEHEDRDVPGMDVPEGHELRFYRSTVKAKRGGMDPSDPIYTQIFPRDN